MFDSWSASIPPSSQQPEKQKRGPLMMLRRSWRRHMLDTTRHMLLVISYGSIVVSVCVVSTVTTRPKMWPVWEHPSVIAYYRHVVLLLRLCGRHFLRPGHHDNDEDSMGSGGDGRVHSPGLLRCGVCQEPTPLSMLCSTNGPHCEHLFCWQCITSWTASRSPTLAGCPLCRARVTLLTSLSQTVSVQRCYMDRGSHHRRLLLLPASSSNNNNNNNPVLVPAEHVPWFEARACWHGLGVLLTPVSFFVLRPTTALSTSSSPSSWPALLRLLVWMLTTLSWSTDPTLGPMCGLLLTARHFLHDDSIGLVMLPLVLVGRRDGAFVLATMATSAWYAMFAMVAHMSWKCRVVTVLVVRYVGPWLIKGAQVLDTEWTWDTSLPSTDLAATTATAPMNTIRSALLVEHRTRVRMGRLWCRSVMMRLQQWQQQRLGRQHYHHHRRHHHQRQSKTGLLVHTVLLLVYCHGMLGYVGPTLGHWTVAWGRRQRAGAAGGPLLPGWTAAAWPARSTGHPPPPPPQRKLALFVPPWWPPWPTRTNRQRRRRGQQRSHTL